ncbi:hypothetical protein (fragment) [Neisseria meningitidis FAM18]|uniref:Uncharacterized protein n=1 Tax=Neisseria meningitidis serogroup C / serotype 2a (strain ATCC 700532 / DSM 15464 / FAM18) TaxID=272831 RepID=A1KTI6_NEIMF
MEEGILLFLDKVGYCFDIMVKYILPCVIIYSINLKRVY